jgi:outer membrane receptor protein involved in Fe transport
LGTVSGSDGYFELEISEGNRGDTLVVSYIGYKTYTFPISQYQDKLIIQLTPDKLILEKPIQVIDDRLDLADYEIPHASDVVDAKMIEQLGSSEIVDYFKTMTSVQVEGNDLAGKYVQIRGSNENEVNVYIDGVLINNLAFDNVADLSVISAENIEHMEVLKGSNLLLLGHGAFGGVVNITTRKNYQTSLLARVKFGQYNSACYIADVNIPLSQKFIVSYFGQLSKMLPEIEYYESERFDQKTTNPSISVARQNHNLSLRYIQKNGVLSAKALSFLFDYEKPFWSSSRLNHILALTYDGSIFGLKQFNISANQLFSNVDYNRQTIGSTEYLNFYKTRRLNFKLAKNFQILKAGVQLAAEYFHDDLTSKSQFRDFGVETTYFDANLYDNRASVAAVISYDGPKDSLQISPWQAFLGLRSDFLANGRQDFTYSFGILFNRMRGRWKNQPYINFGKNIKYPTLFENAFVRDLADAAPVDSVLTILEPEFNSSIELGLNSTYEANTYLYKTLKVNLAFFTKTISNRLIKRPFDDLIFNTQSGENTTLGFESSLGFGQVLRNFSVDMSFTWLNISNPLVYAFKPKLKSSLEIDYRSRQGFFFLFRYFYEGRSAAWYYDAEYQFHSQMISPFFDIDVSFGYNFYLKSLLIRLQAAGYNLLDNSGYRYYYLKKRFLQVSFSIQY